MSEDRDPIVAPGETPAPDAPDVCIDARGMMCPRPVIELARAAKALGTGLIEVIADDPAALTDIPAWCRLRGHRLHSVVDLGGGTTEYRVTAVRKLP